MERNTSNLPVYLRAAEQFGDTMSWLKNTGWKLISITGFLSLALIGLAWLIKVQLGTGLYTLFSLISAILFTWSVYTVNQMIKADKSGNFVSPDLRKLVFGQLASSAFSVIAVATITMVDPSFSFLSRDLPIVGISIGKDKKVAKEPDKRGKIPVGSIITHSDNDVTEFIPPASSIHEEASIKSEKQTAAASKPGEIEEKRAWAYIKRFANLAQGESQKFGIPAAIIMAQGLVESNAGNSVLSRTANNHFGMKAFNWDGPHVVVHDDTPKDKFRKYNSAWESYRDHSLLLLRDNYKSCFRFPKTDWKNWAYELKNRGYATEKDYANILIKVIAKYHLERLDQPISPNTKIAGL